MHQTLSREPDCIWKRVIPTGLSSCRLHLILFPEILIQCHGVHCHWCSVLTTKLTSMRVHSSAGWGFAVSIIYHDTWKPGAGPFINKCKQCSPPAPEPSPKGAAGHLHQALVWFHPFCREKVTPNALPWPQTNKRAKVTMDHLTLSFLFCLNVQVASLWSLQSQSLRQPQNKYCTSYLTNSFAWLFLC